LREGLDVVIADHFKKNQLRKQVSLYQEFNAFRGAVEEEKEEEASEKQGLEAPNDTVEYD